MAKVGTEIKLKTYKGLIAWQKAFELCKKIFHLTKNFPKHEQFGLTSQMKRSALSIPSNIAEGYTRNSRPEYLRFLYISYSSLAELETQVMLAKDLNYIQPDVSIEITQLMAEVQRIMFALIKSLKPKPLNPITL
ncbi:MAG: four helix bundle protein [Candidatus Omnitrophota bacterium]|nr:four helix bundle protein [Candidatus Omnitrophota bacterium]